jgi:hypothetical protein
MSKFKVGDCIRERTDAYDVEAWGGISLGKVVSFTEDQYIPRIQIELIKNYGYSCCDNITDCRLSLIEQTFDIISEKEYLAELLKDL